VEVSSVEYRPFGSTGLRVSELGFGTARLGGLFQGAPKADVLRMLRRAFDGGVNFFDTADMYCGGQSEELIGEAFRGNRADVIIASKAGYALPSQGKVASIIRPFVRPLTMRLGLRRDKLPSVVQGSVTQNFSATYILRAVEGSLKRLRSDYLDLYQLHSPSSSVLENGDFLAPLEKLKMEGKIRHYGVSCETTDDALICLRYPEISSLQLRLSLFEQSALGEVLPLAARSGTAIIARECLAGGLLADQSDTSDPARRRFDTRNVEIDEWKDIARVHGRRLPEMAVQFALAISGVSVVLLGMSSDHHLADNLAYRAARRLSNGELNALKSV